MSINFSTSSEKLLIIGCYAANKYGSITSLEMDNACRNVYTNIVKRVSIQYENNEIIVRKNKSDKMVVEYLDSSRVKKDIKCKVNHNESKESVSIVTFMSQEKNIDLNETLKFFLTCCNSLKIMGKIKDENLHKNKQPIHPKVIKSIEYLEISKKIFSEYGIEIVEKDEYFYLKGDLAYHFKVNLIFISYLSGLLNPNICYPYYQPYYNFESKNTLIKLNYKENKEEIKEYICPNTDFFDKCKGKIKDGSLKIYRVQNPLISYQFHALYWNYTIEDKVEWIDGLQTKTYSLQLFDNKIDAEEFCKIIDMHTLNIISFSNKKLVHKIKSDEFTNTHKPCCILFDAITVKLDKYKYTHGVMPKYVILKSTK